MCYKRSKGNEARFVTFQNTCCSKMNEYWARIDSNYGRTDGFWRPHCQDCMHFSCSVQAVDAEEKWMQDEMASMFGDDEEAQVAFEEGHAPDKD